MLRRLITALLLLTLAFAAASCHSTAQEPESAAPIPEFIEIADCAFDRPCLLVTPENLDGLPDAVRAEAKKHCGKPGTAVVVSSLRPRYLQLLRSQGRLILGTAEINPSVKTAYLCVVNGLGDAAESIRSVSVEHADSPDPWNLGVFVKRYPELAARLGEVAPDDPRRERLAAACTELLSLGSTRNMLERRTKTPENAEQLNAAIQAERRQIEVLEALLSSD